MGSLVLITIYWTMKQRNQLSPGTADPQVLIGSASLLLKYDKYNDGNVQLLYQKDYERITPLPVYSWMIM